MCVALAHSESPSFLHAEITASLVVSFLHLGWSALLIVICAPLAIPLPPFPKGGGAHFSTLCCLLTGALWRKKNRVKIGLQGDLSKITPRPRATAAGSEAIRRDNDTPAPFVTVKGGSSASPPGAMVAPFSQPPAPQSSTVTSVSFHND